MLNVSRVLLTNQLNHNKQINFQSQSIKLDIKNIGMYFDDLIHSISSEESNNNSEVSNFSESDNSDNYSNNSNNSTSSNMSSNMSSNNSKLSCFNCESDNISHDSLQGMLICINCGFIVQDSIIEHTPETYLYDEDGASNSRYGVPINQLLPNSSLSTNIRGIGGAARKIHRWSQMPYSERSLNREYKTISEFCEKNSLIKSIEDDAKMLFKLASNVCYSEGYNVGKRIIFRGASRLSIDGACIFLACVRNGYVKTQKDIANYFGITMLDLNKGYKCVCELLESQNIIIKQIAIKSEHFIREYCNRLMLREKYQTQALTISRNIDRLNLASLHNPHSLSAVSIYIVSKLNNLMIEIDDIANEYKITSGTILRAYKKIHPFISILTNDILTTKALESKNNIIKNKEYITPKLLKWMNRFNVDISDIGSNYDDYLIKKGETNKVMDQVRNNICKISKITINDDVMILNENINLITQIKV